MTNQQIQALIDEATATLRLTTVGYANHSAAWRANQTTKWWQGLDKLRQARAALDKVVVPPPPPPVGSSPFGSRPALAAPPKFVGGHDVVVSGKTIIGLNNGASLCFEGCVNVTVTDVDLLATGCRIYLLSCTGILDIGNVRYRDAGFNFVQFDKCIMSGPGVHDCKGIGGLTEDIVSVYQSGGPDASNPLVIERNHFEGTNWASGSGSGLMLGDWGGSHIVARDNILLNPGQVGIGISGGSDIHVLRNTVYGSKRPGSNVGMYVWNQAGPPSSGIEVASNRVNWKRADGVNNPVWDAGNCGPVAGWGTNDWNAPLDPAALRVVL